MQCLKRHSVQIRLSSRKQAGKVNSCVRSNNEQASKVPGNTRCEDKNKQDSLMMTLEAVKADIANIKSSMAANNHQGNQRDDGTKLKPANILDLKTANGSPIPYESFIEVKFELISFSDGEEVLVPLLVASDHPDSPIIGYNVIEALI